MSEDYAAQLQTIFAQRRARRLQQEHASPSSPRMPGPPPLSSPPPRPHSTALRCGAPPPRVFPATSASAALSKKNSTRAFSAVLLRTVLRFSTLSDLAVLPCVCKLWHLVCSEEWIWKQLAQSYGLAATGSCEALLTPQRPVEKGSLTSASPSRTHPSHHSLQPCCPSKAALIAFVRRGAEREARSSFSATLLERPQALPANGCAAAARAFSNDFYTNCSADVPRADANNSIERTDRHRSQLMFQPRWARPQQSIDDDLAALVERFFLAPATCRFREAFEQICVSAVLCCQQKPSPMEWLSTFVELEMYSLSSVVIGKNVSLRWNLLKRALPIGNDYYDLVELLENPQASAMSIAFDSWLGSSLPELKTEPQNLPTTQEVKGTFSQRSREITSVLRLMERVLHMRTQGPVNAESFEQILAIAQESRSSTCGLED